MKIFPATEIQDGEVIEGIGNRQIPDCFILESIIIEVKNLTKVYVVLGKAREIIVSLSACSSLYI